MKTNLKIFAIAALLFAAPLFASASPPNAAATLKTGMYFTKDGKLNLFVENSHSKAARVIFRDSNNQIVYKTKTGYSKSLSGLKLDIDHLPDGKYTIEITNDKDTVIQAVQLETPKKERVLVPVNQ